MNDSELEYSDSGLGGGIKIFMAFPSIVTRGLSSSFRFSFDMNGVAGFLPGKVLCCCLLDGKVVCNCIIVQKIVRWMM